MTMNSSHSDREKGLLRSSSPWMSTSKARGRRPNSTWTSKARRPSNVHKSRRSFPSKMISKSVNLNERDLSRNSSISVLISKAPSKRPRLMLALKAPRPKDSSPKSEKFSQSTMISNHVSFQRRELLNSSSISELMLNELGRQRLQLSIWRLKSRRKRLKLFRKNWTTIGPRRRSHVSSKIASLVTSPNRT